ncbi:MAG TPA: type II toxin-antitoxin system VapC family toxin [Solirubrobacterales bacterium]|nr:type II toxin-antitoxin system VapC family toxin [Solirubrobacterales bacterium]
MPTETGETIVIEVVSDANVALKWFHSEGEEGVEESRALLASHRDRLLVVHLLDLTLYEVGNALLRGAARADATAIATVLQALREVCPVIAPTDSELSLAAELAADHDLTLYDASYAAVARARGARVATFDRRLLDAGLGLQPGELVSA